jgi:AraC-like DNA-binding protein
MLYRDVDGAVGNAYRLPTCLPVERTRPGLGLTFCRRGGALHPTVGTNTEVEVSRAMRRITWRPVQAATLATFAARHVGHYLAAPTWLNLCVVEDLWVQIIWGRPRDEDIRALLDSLKVQAGGNQAHASLFDCTHVEDMTIKDAHRLRHFLKERHRITGPATSRHALVCATEAIPFFGDGDFVAGLPRPCQVFGDFDAALDWLSPMLTSETRAGIRSVRAEVTSAPCLLTRLRQLLLREDLTKVNVAFAATQLGQSRRSLQRSLAQQGTSFRAELSHNRLNRAKRALSTGASVTWIAYELGFQNVQAFIRAFKHDTGITPGEWRRRDSHTQHGPTEE